MRKVLTLLLILLSCQAVADPIKLDKTLHIKSIDTQNADFTAELKGTLANKDKKLSFTLGYGDTLLGNGFYRISSSIGMLGSGLAYSDLANIATRQGNMIGGYGWGRNGFSLAMDASSKTFALGLAYSGYSNSYSFSFSGTAGSVTGKSTIVGAEGKLDQLATDVTVHF